MERTRAYRRAYRRAYTGTVILFFRSTNRNRDSIFTVLVEDGRRRCTSEVLVAAGFLAAVLATPALAAPLGVLAAIFSLGGELSTSIAAARAESFTFSIAADCHKNGLLCTFSSQQNGLLCTFSSRNGSPTISVFCPQTWRIHDLPPRYASLYFIVGCDQEENELGMLEFIHTLVETLDKYFENVGVHPHSCRNAGQIFREPIVPKKELPRK